MEKIFSLHKTFNIFEGSSAVVYNWINKIENGYNKVTEMKQRQQGRAQLAQLSDRMLQDIGLNRLEVEYEISKPIWKE